MPRQPKRPCEPPVKQDAALSFTIQTDAGHPVTDSRDDQFTNHVIQTIPCITGTSRTQGLLDSRKRKHNVRRVCIDAAGTEIKIGGEVQVHSNAVGYDGTHKTR